MTVTDATTLDALGRMVRAVDGSMTELVSFLRGLELNRVLHSGLVEIPAGGVAQLNTQVPFASVAVQHVEGGWTQDGNTAVGLGATVQLLAESAVVVDAAPPKPRAPNAGVGVLQVPLGGAIVAPLAGTVLSLYGVAGDKLNVALFARPQPPQYVRGETATTVVNTGAGRVWVGPTSAVAVGAGFPLEPGAGVDVPAGSALWVHGEAASSVAWSRFG